MSRPRLHHASGTTAENATATETPATTAITRSRPAVIRETGVTCTTSIAVRGASNGRVPGNSRVATTYAETAAVVTRVVHSSAARPWVRSRRRPLARLDRHQSCTLHHRRQGL